ncbi:MAG: acetoin utilization protein AcuC [Candidatus Syntrophoarchaeum sp. WYZ-LMO15]|nr:MAG: acetoin utilization protein AcuC [Candidatus Syntrophoarchaeum sp. WYZ-LMO15]
MDNRVAFIYSDAFLGYDFGKSHPLNPVRLLLTFRLIKDLGLLEREDVTLLEPEYATREDLLRVHTPEFIDAVKSAGEGKLPRSPFIFTEFGLGYGDNPIFEGMYEASSLYVGASLKAARLIVEGDARRAFNISGGLHHATASRASGFCIFNDPAIAISYLKEHFERVMYIDIDAHHGDGVQWIFYDDPSVLTVSFHESGRYLFPGTGEIGEIGEGEGKGYAVNIPLPRGTSDPAYLYAFGEIVPELAEVFEPGIVVTQLGADTHFLDPLTDLSLTTRAYSEIGKMLDEITQKLCDGRWLALGGGGYDMTVVPRAWSIHFARMVGLNPDYSIPEDWMRFCENTIHRRPPRELLDSETPGEDPSILEEVRGVVEDVKRYHRAFFSDR